MTLDSTAAAYGLVQVVFADVTDKLATAVFVLKQRRDARITSLDQICKLKFMRLQFVLKRRRDASVTVEQIYKLEFKRLLEAFRDELKQFDGQIELVDDLRLLREACQGLEAVSQWRNDRIHARVRQVDDGLALYDRAGKRLSISHEECVGITDKLTKVIVALEAYLPSIFKSIDFDKALSNFLADLEKATEEPEHAPTMANHASPKDGI